jgi:hypothetical protein
MKTGFWFSIAFGFGLLSTIVFAPRTVSSFAESDRNTRSPARLTPIELLPLRNPERPNELEQAYLDSFSILKDENSCSAFYGGPSSITVLNELTQQLKPTHLDRHVGIRMSGETTIVLSAVTGFTFRLFQKAEVNLDGPFYQSRFASSRGRVPPIGPFEPNTREARVTTMLHELGHLLRRPDGQWLLPNDGRSAGESEANTQRVLDVCGEQIRSLHNFSFAEELLGARTGGNVKEGSGG